MRAVQVARKVVMWETRRESICSRQFGGNLGGKGGLEWRWIWEG